MLLEAALAVRRCQQQGRYPKMVIQHLRISVSGLGAHMAVSSLTKSTFVCLFLLLALAGSIPGWAGDDAVEATQLLRSGKYDAAAEAYRAILSEQPLSVTAHTGLTRSLLKQEKVAEALDSAKSSLARLPDTAALHTALGEIYFRKAWIPEAEGEFRKALKLDPKLARAWLGLGRIADLVSKRKTAKGFSNRLIAWTRRIQMYCSTGPGHRNRQLEKLPRWSNTSNLCLTRTVKILTPFAVTSKYTNIWVSANFPCWPAST